MNPPIHSTGDQVLASFPSGWTLGGTVLMIIQTHTSTSYEVVFKDGSHSAFLEENVKKA